MPTWPHVTCPTKAFKPSRCGPRGTLADIGVNDLNGLWGPTQRTGPLGEGVLEPEAFLMAQSLVGGSTAEYR